jgi:outer membrane protein OmpA-like peptidoglycan-associated protein
MTTSTPLTSKRSPFSVAIRTFAVASLTALAACASLPPSAELQALQTRYEVTAAQPYAAQQAKSELDETREALDLGRIAYKKHDDDALAHYLIVGDKALDIADARVHLATTNASIASSSAIRESMVRQARERQLARAEAETRAAEAATQAAAANARAAQSEADRRGIALTAQQQELAAREAELRSQELALAQRNQELAEANAKVETLEQQAKSLADQLVEVTTVINERGTVLVLSDIVFDFDSAALKPGSDHALDEIAAFLVKQDSLKLKVEGHADSIGSHEYNLKLSRERAASVRDALVDRGVNSARVSIAGYGEDYPVASNDTDAGRQLNRRVEIVLNDKIGRPISSRN